MASKISIQKRLLSSRFQASAARGTHECLPGVVDSRYGGRWRRLLSGAGESMISAFNKHGHGRWPAGCLPCEARAVAHRQIRQEKFDDYWLRLFSASRARKMRFMLCCYDGRAVPPSLFDLLFLAASVAMPLADVVDFVTLLAVAR